MVNIFKKRTYCIFRGDYGGSMLLRGYIKGEWFIITKVIDVCMDNYPDADFQPYMKKGNKLYCSLYGDHVLTRVRYILLSQNDIIIDDLASAKILYGLSVF